MQGKAKLLGHPVHPMLIVFPLGLLATSLAFDIAWLATGSARWSEIAFYMIASGLVGGVFAAVFGVIDFRAIPRRTRARRIGAMHGIGNAIVMLLFGISWAIRTSDPGDPAAIGLGRRRRARARDRLARRRARRPARGRRGRGRTRQRPELAH